MKTMQQIGNSVTSDVKKGRISDPKQVVKAATGPNQIEEMGRTVRPNEGATGEGRQGFAESNKLSELVKQVVREELLGKAPHPMGPNDPDPFNNNPNLPPATMEDDPNGYWDSQNWGNGMGTSFLARNDQTYPADPVGNGPMDVNRFLQMIAATRGR